MYPFILLIGLSNLAISEIKFDQMEKEVEILKQELQQARQAGSLANLIYFMTYCYVTMFCYSVFYLVMLFCLHSSMYRESDQPVTAATTTATAAARLGR